MSSKIAILGIGNVAWHSQSAFENSGHVITHIYGRNLKKAERLVQNSYQAEATDSLDFSASQTEIFLMCLADDGLAEFTIHNSTFIIHNSPFIIHHS